MIISVILKNNMNFVKIERVNNIEKNSAYFRKKFETEKYAKLVAAVLIDLIGFISYLIPALGEFFDMLLAPISAILVYILFGKKFKWAIFTLLEEMLPMTDVIPSATIAWYSMYVTNEIKTIEEMSSKMKEKEQAFNNLDQE